MNVSELARRLRVHPKKMMEILPAYGFDIGKKAVKIDDKVADNIMFQWKRIIREIEEKEKREQEEKRQKEKELRKQTGETVFLSEFITVREFADRLGLPVTQVITELMKNGILANQNQNIDFDTAAIMAEEFGFSVKQEEKHSVENNEEEQKTHVLEQALAKGKHMEPRPPVIVVMGHVDHGKTKLLDTIRQTNIVAKESGGITQHIGAYQTVWKDPKTSKERALTFIDTPGHEAFTVMRSRGAKVADLAILVVAADDGVKPQTEEVIQIIHAAKLPCVVAINKIDKETADVSRVKTELSHKNVIAEEWGGDVPMVEISAKNQINIDKLLDTLILVADMHADTIQADPGIPAVGTVIESHNDKHMGPVATVLIQAGTLRKHDLLVVENEIYGNVRAMRDYTGTQIDTAPPSMPVQIIGFKVAPEVGDILDVSAAKTASKIDIKQKKTRQTGAQKQYHDTAKENDEDEDKKKFLNLVVKADVLGSLEAIIGSLENLRHEEVGVKIIGKGLGNIMEDDVKKAIAGHGIIVGFHVKANSDAEENMREETVVLKQFSVIYDLLDWVKDELEKLLSAEKIVTELGKVKVLATFRTDKGAMTVGGRVEHGKIQKGTLVRVKREGELIGEGKLVGCQTGKQDVKEVPSGTECGIRYEGKVKIDVGDVLEVYKEESKSRKIEFEK